MLIRKHCNYLTILSQTLRQVIQLQKKFWEVSFFLKMHFCSGFHQQWLFLENLFRFESPAGTMRSPAGTMRSRSQFLTNGIGWHFFNEMGISESLQIDKNSFAKTRKPCLTQTFKLKLLVGLWEAHSKQLAIFLSNPHRLIPNRNRCGRKWIFVYNIANCLYIRCFQRFTKGHFPI